MLARALPKSRLREVLEAFREATTAGLDVQLKILQALPSLLHNYADDLQGELLAAALNVCAILQSSKNGIVNNTAAATLQQLVVTVFDKVVTEDDAKLDPGTVGAVPTDDGMINLKPAAMDAFLVFTDLCLLTESQKSKFIKSSGLPKTFGLELIESVLTNHADIFLTHPEQAHVLRTRVMPFIINAISDKLNFAVTVRVVRILYTLLRRHLSILGPEGEMALGILTHTLDQDTAMWKRALCMEVLRGLFAEATLVRKMYALFDQQEASRPILRNIISAFVKISTEKPAVIGLSHQSTMPAADQVGIATDQAMLEASGVPGIMSSGASSNENGSGRGISMQWSTMRVPCIDQLDKTDPPAVPESYIYSLTLACVSGFAEGLAKFILPLTVPERQSRKRVKAAEAEAGSDKTAFEGSHKIPINPLMLEKHALHTEVKACAGMIDDCWPALLATCTTFLNAALDQDYYHSLVRSFQKFAHVAGLLRLSTPRDAFLTSLGKAAVPPHVINANFYSGPPTPTSESSGMLNNARGLLGVDNAVHERKVSAATTQSATLNTRNMLCLRALLNLGIALGPTLAGAWAIILETLQQADMILFSTQTSTRNPSSTKPDDQSTHEDSSLLVNFGTEIKAVETATTRLLESTADFPNQSFREVVTAICSLLAKDTSSRPTSSAGVKTASTPDMRRQPHRRITSISIVSVAQNQEDLFALAKLGEVASINLERLTLCPPETSGWQLIIAELIATSCSTSSASSIRCRAAETLVEFVLEAASVISSIPEHRRNAVQAASLQALVDCVTPLQALDTQASVASTTSDVEVHKIVLDGLKSLVEQAGGTFVAGWDAVFEIIQSIYAAGEETAGGSRHKTKARSPKLLRSAFGTVQLICSDFLSSLPNTCFLVLVDTLHSFCTQKDDLNIALTVSLVGPASKLD